MDRQSKRASITRRTLLKAGAAGAALFSGLGLLPTKALAATPDLGDVATIVAGMTRRQKIAQKIMPDFRQWDSGSGVADMTVLDEKVAEIVDKYDLGGVILFANNVKETEQTLRLCMGLQEAATRNASGEAYGNIPLLITIDQEGGIVYRLGSGTALPGNMAVGATRSVDDARECGEVIGRELNALKLNVNFAPSFDVNSNPNNPVIGLRSISGNPDLVAELGVPMMKGMQEHNVATAAKHFPGHGDAGTDSHTGLPRIEKTEEELWECEFIPFQAAIDNGVDMVMTAHIQFPKVETDTATSIKDGSTIELPATLSHVFMTDILRGEMGFTGVSVTDALNMDAIATNFGEVDAVKRAFKAGVDIALMPTMLRSAADEQKLADLIDALVADAEITDEMLDESVTRILTLKKARGILQYAETAGTVEDNLPNALAVVGSDENRAIEREVSASAVTVIRNEGDVLPFRPASGAHVLLVGAWSNEQPGMELTMRRLVDEKVIPADVTYESLNYAESYSSPDEALADITPKLADADYAIVISEVGSTANLNPDRVSGSSTYVPTRVVRAANEAGVPVAVMSISLPYDCAMYDEAPAVVAVYGNKGMDPTEGLQPSAAFGPNVPAGVEVIFGCHAAEGKLPVDLYAVNVDENGASFDLDNVKYPLGYGLTYPGVNDKPAVDNSALATAVADAERTVLANRDAYTADSLAAFLSAYDAAKALLDDPEATQEELDAALARLNEAMDALVLASAEKPGDKNPSGTDSGTGPGTGSDGKKPSGSGPIPETGDPTAFAAVAAAAVAGVAAMGAGAAMHAEDEE
ncbi:glycoside hydrolase family 3 N-terminal domain-containing protein [Olsenella sp. An290]|uniref:glycoside hydrolase family 3 N-terminal domain-containing protein n=1 Tax=Olsenella sp. An290 TaxID=1965625 RepID=UPI000B383404|nr:glycoside hydrolase family 3 N-terminal domain-containing protein [Olsenella sp. An290]OUO35751.1 beta-hexosaminidase [Olsenella sp. An290]